MTIILVVSDLHINSTVALCRPSVSLDDGGTYHASPGQTWLWHKWQELIALAEAAAKRDRLALVLNGDIAEGDVKERSLQLITRNEATIQRMVVDLIEPLCKAASVTFVVRGTPAHGGKSAHIEEAIANDIEAEGPTKDVHSWFDLPLEWDGVRGHISHKTTGGGLPWTAKQAAIKLAAKTVFEYGNRRERIPDFVIRSHVHTMGDSYDAYSCRALITPAWTYATEYVKSNWPIALADVGSIFIKTQGGRKEVWKFHPEPEKTQWVRLPQASSSPN